MEKNLSISQMAELHNISRQTLILEKIKEHIENRNITTAMSLLKSHEEYIEKEINKLLLTRDFIKQRLDLYSNAHQFKDELCKPTIEILP